MTKTSVRSVLFWFFGLFALYLAFQWAVMPYLDTHALRRALRIVDGTHNQCHQWGALCIYVMPEHVLYIYLMYLLNQFLSLFGIINPILINHLVFALFAALFGTVAIQLSSRLHLQGWKRFFSVGFLTLGAPGMVVMLVQTEDDIAYFGLLLLFWWWMARRSKAQTNSWDPRVEANPWKEGLIAGTLLGVAMTINPIVLIYLALGALVPWFFWRKEWPDVVRICVMGVTSIAVFYLIYLPLYPNELNYHDPFFTNLKRAFGLWRGLAEDFKGVPFFSKAYALRSYRGATNMVLQPKHPYMGLKDWFVTVQPWVWVGMLSFLLVRCLTHLRNEAVKTLPRLWLYGFFFLVALGQSLIFETGVNERWSMTFLAFGMLLWLVWSLETRWWNHLVIGSFVLVQLFLGVQNLGYQSIGQSHVKYHRKLKTLQRELATHAFKNKVEVAILPVRYIHLDLYARALLSKATHRILFVRPQRVRKPGQIPWTFHRPRMKKEPFFNFQMVEYFDEWFLPSKIKHELTLAQVRKLLKGRKVFLHPELRKQWAQWFQPRHYLGGK